MPTAVFTGSVRPEWQAIQLDVTEAPLRITLSDSAGGVCTIAFLIGHSQLSFVVKTEREIEDIGQFRNEIFSAVRPLFDLIGYLSGQVVRFELPSVTFTDTERITVFLDAVPGIYDKIEERPLGVESLFSVAISNRHFARALADLRATIEMFNDTAFYAFRAVEDVMQAFSAAESDRAEAWTRMRATLQLTRQFIKPLEVESKFARHGNPRYLSGPERIDLMVRAWRGVDRFAVFLHYGGTAPLPEEKFALL
jgi:hypothetical protein